MGVGEDAGNGMIPFSTEALLRKRGGGTGIVSSALALARGKSGRRLDDAFESGLKSGISKRCLDLLRGKGRLWESGDVCGGEILGEGGKATAVAAG